MARIYFDTTKPMVDTAAKEMWNTTDGVMEIISEDKRDVGIVQTQYLTFAEEKDWVLSSGKKFGPITIAFETYGTLDSRRSNAILIAHALSGDAHAAGFQSGAKKPGWWDNMIGPGKAFDTDKYFVICSNVLGGCQGSTGPSSMDPDTGGPYALQFPVIGIDDMINCQRYLIDTLGIEKLLCVAGGSMGGMQVLAWMIKYPQRISSAIPVATALRHTPQQIAFNEVGRQAITADPNWDEGNYYGKAIPAQGLAVARMLGHITYMSDESMMEKFGRQKKENNRPFKLNAAAYEVEGYLRYHGDNFVKRFDANSYLYITKAMDNFDPLGEKPFRNIFEELRAKVMVIAFKSDWLYPAYQSKEIVRACKLSGVEVTYCEIDSTYGHDAFLLETKEETHLVGHFLKTVFNSQ